MNSIQEDIKCGQRLLKFFFIHNWLPNSPLVFHVPFIDFIYFIPVFNHTVKRWVVTFFFYFKINQFSECRTSWWHNVWFVLQKCV